MSHQRRQVAPGLAGRAPIRSRILGPERTGRRAAPWQSASWRTAPRAVAPRIATSAPVAGRASGEAYTPPWSGDVSEN